MACSRLRPRDAAKATVLAQKLQKSQQVNVDAKVIKGQVEAANNQKLAALRKEAEQKKAEAARKAAEQQKTEGPVTVESLKQKLETESTAEKDRLKLSFDTKWSELKIRLQTQRETLQAETQKQIDNWKTQEFAQKARLEAEFEKQKVQWTEAAKKLEEQMKMQVAADAAD